MLGDPGSWDRLMSVLEGIVTAHLRAQVAAGAQALQVFDSWVGALDPEDYERSVAPTMRRIFQALSGLDIPTIHFGLGTGELLGRMRSAGGDVIGVDHRVPLDAAWDRIGADRAVQGNLDPAALLAPWEVVEHKAVSVLERAAGRDGHVFNLGHGVLPSTPVEHVQQLVELVHIRTERPQA
jgi:uroporphyrinogen decarboxylase